VIYRAIIFGEDVTWRGFWIAVALVIVGSFTYGLHKLSNSNGNLKTWAISFLVGGIFLGFATLLVEKTSQDHIDKYGFRTDFLKSYE
jgi:hypothetical protein